MDGVQSAVILSRESKASSQTGKESAYNGVFSPGSSVASGSIIQTETGEQFLTSSLRLTTYLDKYCGMVKVNAKIEVQRYTQDYDGNDNPIGLATFAAVISDVPAYAEYASGKLRQEDPGLLPTTVYLLRMQKTVDVKRPDDPDLIQPDRILLNGRAYQVDVIDEIKYPGLYQIQLSEDRRQ